jgi:hypothetical protein
MYRASSQPGAGAGAGPQQPPPGPDGPQGEKKGGDNVVDAEFVDVDDKK